MNVVQNACIRLHVQFRNHTSSDRLSEDEINGFFKEPFLSQHVVLAVKGFFRRANLIPNRWKLRIGATHELCTTHVDNSVQVQGLPGRMTGYWREVIEAGHKTGPHRTSIRAIEEYEKTYDDPFGSNCYQSSGFHMKNGKISADSTMLSVQNILNMEPVDLPHKPLESSLYRVYIDEKDTREVCKILGYYFKETKDNVDGFKETSLNAKTNVVSLQDTIKKVPNAYGIQNGEKVYRTYYPCYVNTSDKTSLRFVVIIRPGTDETKLLECDTKFPPYDPPR